MKAAPSRKKEQESTNEQRKIGPEKRKETCPGIFLKKKQTR